MVNIFKTLNPVKQLHWNYKKAHFKVPQRHSLLKRAALAPVRASSDVKNCTKIDSFLEIMTAATATTRESIWISLTRVFSLPKHNYRSKLHEAITNVPISFLQCPN